MEEGYPLAHSESLPPLGPHSFFTQTSVSTTPDSYASESNLPTIDTQHYALGPLDPICHADQSLLVRSNEQVGSHIDPHIANWPTIDTLKPYVVRPSNTIYHPNQSQLLGSNKQVGSHNAHTIHSPTNNTLQPYTLGPPDHIYATHQTLLAMSNEQVGGIRPWE